MELSAVERLNMKERKTMAKQWVTASEAAKILKVSRHKIYNSGKAGQIKTKRDGRSVFFQIEVEPEKAPQEETRTQEAGGVQPETRALLKALSKGKGRSREGERALRAWKKAGMPDVGECPTCGRALTN